MNKMIKGSISIFLALVILPLYSIALAVMDIAKIGAANSHIQIANEISLDSILSLYDKELNERYGIFAYDINNNIDEINNKLLMNNLDENYSSIYKIGLKESKINTENEKLINNINNIENQIINYMKYYGPYNIGKGILNLVDLTMSSKEYTGVMNKKLEYEEEYSKVNNNLDTLYKNFIKYDDLFLSVNENFFNSNKRLNEIVKEINKSDEKLIILNEIKISKDATKNEINKKALSLINDNFIQDIYKIYIMIEEDFNSESINKLIKENIYKIERLFVYKNHWSINDRFNVNEEIDLDLSNSLNYIKKYIDDYNNSERKIIISKIKEYNEFNKSLRSDISVLKVIYNDSISSLEKLSKDSVSLQNKLDQWGNSISDLEESSIKNNFNSDYKSTQFQFSKENIDKLLKKLQDSSPNLPNMIETMDNNEDLFYIDYSNFLYLENKKINLDGNKKMPSLRNFKIYKYVVDNKNEEKIDFEKKKNSKNIKDSVVEFGNKKQEIDEIKDNKNNTIYDFIDKEKLSNLNGSTSISFGNKNNISNYKNIFSQVDSMIPSNKNNLIEDIYLAQYIIDKFNNKLDNKDFNNQIEYILFGNEKLNSNESIINNYIFGLRFILNSVYAYTNSDLRLEANSIATAIAGWTGFGVPLLRTMILSSMSFGESIIDIETLNSNKNLEAFKNKSSWKVSISSLPTLIGNKVKDVATDGIDNIYDELITISEDKIDQADNYINEFLNQTIDGLAQSIISQIISPIQISIYNFINQGKENFINEIESQLNDIEKSLGFESSDELGKIKNIIFNEVKSSILSNVGNINSINVESYFNNLIKSTESKIKSITSKYSNNFKNNIKSSLEKNKYSRKESIEKSIDDYLGDLGMKEIKKNEGVTSGLSFRYDDYLLLVTLFRINTGNKEEILRRMINIIEYEISRSNNNFNMENMYIGLSINTEIKINTFIINKYIYLRKIENSIEGGY